jgi:hypothetical protein
MRVLAFNETIDAKIQAAAGATECFSTMKELEGLLGL